MALKQTLVISHILTPSAISIAPFCEGSQVKSKRRRIAHLKSVTQEPREGQGFKPWPPAFFVTTSDIAVRVPLCWWKHLTEPGLRLAQLSVTHSHDPSRGRATTQVVPVGADTQPVFSCDHFPLTRVFDTAVSAQTCSSQHRCMWLLCKS